MKNQYSEKLQKEDNINKSNFFKKMIDFFNFKIMISATLIKLFFILSLFVLLAFLVHLTKELLFHNIFFFILGLFGAAFSFLIIRVLFEIFILFFSIHESLEAIRNLQQKELDSQQLGIEEVTNNNANFIELSKKFDLLNNRMKGLTIEINSLRQIFKQRQQTAAAKTKPAQVQQAKPTPPKASS